jgi:hypothetical protein
MVLEKYNYAKQKIEKTSFHSIESWFQNRIYLGGTKVIHLKVAPLYQFQCFHHHEWNFEKHEGSNGLTLNAWICTHTKNQKYFEKTHYQMNNLTNVASLLWFALNVKNGNSLDLLGVYGFKWFNMYVIQNNIVSILLKNENEKKQ